MRGTHLQQNIISQEHVFLRKMLGTRYGPVGIRFLWGTQFSLILVARWQFSLIPGTRPNRVPKTPFKKSCLWVFLGKPPTLHQVFIRDDATKTMERSPAHLLPALLGQFYCRAVGESAHANVGAVRCTQLAQSDQCPDLHCIGLTLLVKFFEQSRTVFDDERRFVVLRRRRDDGFDRCYLKRIKKYIYMYI